MSFFNRLKNSVLDFGHWSAPVAGMIDRSYKTRSSSFFSQLYTFFKVRFLFTFLFIPLSAADLLVSGILGVRFAFSTFFTTDDLQEQRLASQRKYSTIFSKNLWALTACIFGIINPKLISFYFTPQRTDKPGIGAGGDYYRDPHVLKVEPETIDDVLQAVKKAVAEGKKVMPVGAGRSQGKQFLPDTGNASIILDLAKLNDVTIDVVSKTVTVGAGACWADIQRAADKKKLALQVMQASNVFSVGGSIGTNIHGWDQRLGVLANTILEMTIVNAKGELQTLTRKDELFYHILGGTGLFGIVVEAKIQLTDNELMREVGTKIAPEEYIEHFRKNVEPNTNIGMHLYRLSISPDNMLGEGIAVDYVRTNPGVGLQTENLKMEPAEGTRLNKIMLNLARRIGAVRSMYWKGEVRRLTKAEPAEPQTRNQIMQPPINAMFNAAESESEWLQEYFLPPETLVEFLKELSNILTENDVPLINASVRYVPQYDKSPLSYAHDGERFAVVLCFNQALDNEAIVRAEKWLRKAQQLCVDKGGSYYLPYQHVSDPDTFNKSYPHADKAIKKKNEVDPDHVFSSGFARKYLFPEDTRPNYFRTIMNSEENKKAFRGFLEVVLKQVDAEPLYKLLDDILQYKDSHAEIYTELCRRLPEIKPGMIGGFRRILDSLSAIKGDLAEQAQALLPAEWKSIDGLVEIGYPGRFINGFKERYQINGMVAAVYEEPGLTDYIQTGFPRPYNKFQKLDYNVPSLAGLADNSADVITCYVGLHHFPDEKLDAFLQDVRRVLRNGGRFLLVDHDVIDEKAMAMAHMAHTIFNAATGVSLQEELAEVRNFRPISEWRERLAKHGLMLGDTGPDVPMIREGDPSRNRMICVTKPALKPAMGRIAKVSKISSSNEKKRTFTPEAKHHSGTSLFTSGTENIKKNAQDIKKKLPKIIRVC